MPQEVYSGLLTPRWASGSWERPGRAVVQAGCLQECAGCVGRAGARQGVSLGCAASALGKGLCRRELAESRSPERLGLRAAVGLVAAPCSSQRLFEPSSEQSLQSVGSWWALGV